MYYLCYNPLSTDGHYSGHLAKNFAELTNLTLAQSLHYNFKEFTSLVCILEHIRCFRDHV